MSLKQYGRIRKKPDASLGEEAIEYFFEK